MEAVTLVGRLPHVSAEHVVENLSALLDDTLGLTPSPEISLVRRFLINWAMMYIGSLLLYFVVAGLDYLIVFGLFASRLLPKGYVARVDLRREIATSVWSLLTMTAMSVAPEMGVQLGYSKVYHNVSDHGIPYLLLSPFLFLAFSDCLIYFLHRGLHHRLLYKYLHKPHHSFIHTSPFAAFAFHPVDGWVQGIPYHIFGFLFPMHGVMHLASLAVVSMWTINIHDRVTLGIPGVNGAAHHTIHHTTFKSNYGQYTTLWDKLFGTFHDPRDVKATEVVKDAEKIAYGKDT